MNSVFDTKRILNSFSGLLICIDQGAEGLEPTTLLKASNGENRIQLSTAPIGNRIDISSGSLKKLQDTLIQNKVRVTPLH